MFPSPACPSALPSPLDDAWSTLAFPLNATMDEHFGGGCSLRQGPVSTLLRDPVAKEVRRGVLRRTHICIYTQSPDYRGNNPTPPNQHARPALCFFARSGTGNPSVPPTEPLSG